MSYRRDPISNSDDIIDSRDVIARIDELESELRTAYENLFAGDEDTGASDAGFEAWLANTADANGHEHQDAAVELQILRSVAEEGESASSDWRHGETMIRDSHFEDWTRQFAEDIGALEKADSWPCTCIDWERAASELQHDYTTISFDGVDYWVRSC